MWIFIAPFVGGFLGSALAGLLVGLVVVASVKDTYPREHDPEREWRRLADRLRRPEVARLKRWLALD